MSTIDMKIKAVLTEESIKKMASSISLEDVNREIDKHLATKTSQEIEIEVKKHGGEQSYIESLAKKIIAIMIANKAKNIVIGTGLVGGAAVATPSMAAQFSEFTKLKATDLDNVGFFTDQQKEALLNATNNVDATDIASSVSDVDVDSDLLDTIISTIAAIFGMG